MANEIREAFPVIKRKVFMDYAEWLAIVQQGGKKYLNPVTAQRMYDEGWDALEAIEVILDQDLYSSPPKPKKTAYEKIVYDVDYVNRRIAEALLKEATRLLVKNLTNGARQLALETLERVKKILSRA